MIAERLIDRVKGWIAAGPEILVGGSDRKPGPVDFGFLGEHRSQLSVGGQKGYADRVIERMVYLRRIMFEPTEGEEDYRLSRNIILHAFVPDPDTSSLGLGVFRVNYQNPQYSANLLNYSSKRISNFLKNRDMYGLYEYYSRMLVIDQSLLQFIRQR